MKSIYFALFSFAIIFILSCTTDDDLTVIDACEYILPDFESTQTFSNGITTFQLNFGPDTIADFGNPAIADFRWAVLDETGLEFPFFCSSTTMVLGSAGENIYDQWTELDWFDGTDFSQSSAQAYITDGQLDARSWIGDGLDATYLHPNALPFMITTGMDFKNIDEDSMGADNTQGWLQFTIQNEDDPNLMPTIVARLNFIRQLVELIDEHEVNGIVYEDVIRVEMEIEAQLYPDYQYGDDSNVREVVYDYWFAKGIGLIETTDRNFKLEGS